jgi:hypothetical protein
LSRASPSPPSCATAIVVRIEMFDGKGASIFGTIEQQVERYAAP